MILCVCTAEEKKEPKPKATKGKETRGAPKKGVTKHRPLHATTASDAVSLTQRWKTQTDKKTGKVYYYHTVTKKTTWVKPADYEEPSETPGRNRMALLHQCILSVYDCGVDHTVSVESKGPHQYDEKEAIELQRKAEQEVEAELALMGDEEEDSDDPEPSLSSTAIPAEEFASDKIDPRRRPQR